MPKFTIFLLWIFFISLPIQAQEKTNEITIITLTSPELGTDRTIRIFLPKDYLNSNKSYPVLYMHDGQNLFDAKTSFSGEWEVDETLKSLELPLIAVGIDNGGDKRIDELTPFVNAQYGGGNADSYLKFITQTVKPYIDSKYRTLKDQKNTGIMGSSLGGLVSFYAGLKYSDTFGKIGVFSPSFWYSNQIYTLAEKASISNVDMYFLCGNKEGFDTDVNMLKMVRQLKQNSSYHPDKIAWKIILDGEHNEKLWRENFKEAILWLFAR